MKRCVNILWAVARYCTIIIVVVVVVRCDAVCLPIVWSRLQSRDPVPPGSTHTTIKKFVTFWSYSSYDHYMTSMIWSWCGHDVVIHIWPHYHDATTKNQNSHMTNHMIRKHPFFCLVWPTMWPPYDQFIIWPEYDQLLVNHMTNSSFDQNITNSFFSSKHMTKDMAKIIISTNLIICSGSNIKCEWFILCVVYL